MTSTDGPRAAIAFSLRADGYTGVQTHTRLLQQGLEESGVPCALVTPFSGGKHWLPVFALRPLLLTHLNRNWSTRWHRYWHFVALRANLRQYLARNRAAIVIAQCVPSALAALDVRHQLGADFSIALVCHFTMSEAEELAEKGVLTDQRVQARIAAEERYAIENVDLVIHDSEWQRLTLEKTRGLRPKSSTVVWHGIAASVPQKRLTRAALGYAAADVILVNVGSLEPRKNQLALIDAFVHWSTRAASLRLLLVGANGPDRRAVEQRIASANLTSKVKLLVDWPDVPSILGIADVYVHYATIESFGIVLLEAARAGLPVAATPVGGTTEVLARLGGIALSGDDVDASWRALEPLTANRSVREEMGRRARRNFEEAFTRERMIASYLDACELSPSPRTDSAVLLPTSPA